MVQPAYYVVYNTIAFIIQQAACSLSSGLFLSSMLSFVVFLLFLPFACRAWIFYHRFYQVTTMSVLNQEYVILYSPCPAGACGSCWDSVIISVLNLNSATLYQPFSGLDHSLQITVFCCASYSQQQIMSIVLNHDSAMLHSPQDFDTVTAKDQSIN